MMKRSPRKIALHPFPVEHDRILSQIETKSSAYWEKRRKEHALEVFHQAAKRVPAYKDFLRKHKIKPESIKNFADFEKLPHITKKNYVRKHTPARITWDGAFTGSLIYTSTSGSTGEPSYFLRGEALDRQGSVVQELFFKNSVNAEAPTLVIICFGMGIWIGGLITLEGVRMLGESGYTVSIVTPGINKGEIFRALKRLSPSYAQTVIYGYPPFIKDILDEAPSLGINLKKLNVRISTAAETFTEDFRSYIGKQSGMKDASYDTMNIYGSADIGAMAFETPLSIDIRRIASKKKKVFDDIFFNAPKTPTLAQFIPEFINFEEVGDELVITGSSAMPLVRYSIGDHGGVYSYQEMKKKLAKHGIAMPKPRRGKQHSELPFVYVFERNDFSTTLYGAKIFPEAIREVLLRSPFSKYLTGKFTLITKYDKASDQYLEINLELRKDRKASSIFKSQLLNHITKSLVAYHSEYKELLGFIGKRAHPRLVFWPSEDPRYFKPGIKQTWVER